METQQLLKLYDISFEETRHDNMSPTRNFLGGGEMETFFLFMRGHENIEEDVIPVIDHYIKGNPFPIDNDLTVGGASFVDVEGDGVKFINRETMETEQVVPLEHFKIIAQAWADYNNPVKNPRR